MSDCDINGHTFAKIPKDYFGILMLMLWNFALLGVVVFTILLFQFYWIVLILIFISGWKNWTYCEKCGKIIKLGDDE